MSSKSHSHPSHVVALPSMTHNLTHLPSMSHSGVDPRCLRYGGLGASKEASQAKLQQTLQHSSYASSSSNGARPAPPPPAAPRKDDGEFLMMKQGRKK